MAETKQLLLLRHGKASWQPQFQDFDRPLTGTGERQSRCIADWLRQAAILPDCWLVSAARRTVQTADIIRLRLGQQDTAQNVFSSLYLAEAGQILTTLQAVPDTAQCVVLVGHNPGISELLIQLAGPPLGKFDVAPDIMWPASLAVFSVNSNWSDIAAETLQLTALVHGKQLAKES